MTKTKENVSQRAIKHGKKYTVYPNGMVYEGQEYKFTIEESNILDYIIEGRWGGTTYKTRLDNLLDGYPDSFGFLTDLRDVIQEVAPEAVKDIRDSFKNYMANTHKLMDMPLKERVAELLKISKNGNLYEYYHFKQARWVSILEALDFLLDKKG